MKTTSILSVTVLIAGLMLAGFSWAQSKPKGGEISQSEPIIVKAKTLEWDNEQERVTFTGNVHAKMEGFTVDCWKMEVYYEGTPEKKNSAGGDTKIKQIVAMGKVKINRTEGGEAASEKAVYYGQDEKLILTGNPVVKQGKDFVEGERITIFLKENRSVVEGSEEKRVKAIIFPREKKK